MRFGKYEVLDELGRGAMGVIYRARDPGIDRLVAVKALTPEAAKEAKRRERFTQEARIAGQLSHENIVKVYDFGEEGGLPYLAMEYLEGTDLRTIIRDRIELLSDKKLQILLQVARGLQYAHTRGVVHRDIKPENVRLLDDGVVKIMDFGVALRVEDREASGGLHGTVAYMAPERLEGRDATPASDLWAFGVLAYELLTFHQPFPADNYAAMMERITRGKPVPFDQYRVLVHPRLRDLVFKLLERDPGKRHGSAAEVVEELEEFMSEDATRRKDAQVGFEKALQHYRGGNFKAAIAGWEETLKMEPDHFPARNHLKMAREKVAGLREAKLLGKLAAHYVEREVPDKALHYYREVLRVDPHHTGAQEAVRMLGGLGELAPPAAPSPLPPAVRSGGFRLPPAPPTANPEVRRALQLVKKEQLADGVAVLRDILARHPGDAVAQDYLMRIVKRIRKRVFAEKALVQSYIERGNACFQTERFQEAEEAWNAVLSMDEGNLIARKNLEVLAAYLRGTRADEEIAYPEGQRFHNRVPANVPVRYRGLFAAKAVPRDGSLHRLSISGMSVLVDEPVPVSAVLELSFVIPGKGTKVELLGQVLHAVAEPFGQHLVGTVLLLVPEAYVEFVKELQD